MAATATCALPVRFFPSREQGKGPPPLRPRHPCRRWSWRIKKLSPIQAKEVKVVHVALRVSIDIIPSAPCAQTEPTEKCHK